MNLLSVNQLSFAYPGQVPIFKRVSFNIRAGEILTLLGPNGVGKSTLLRCLLGLVPPASGNITLASTPLDRLSRQEIAHHLAYVPQDYHAASTLSVQDYLLTARAAYLRPFQTPGPTEIALVQHYLQRFRLADLATIPFVSLSGGQQQLIAIIHGLVQQPRVLVLDEPMVALDLGRQAELITLFKKIAAKGMAIILTTHLPDHAFMLGGQVGLFTNDQQVVVGSQDALLTQEKLTAVYQTPLSVVYLPKLGRYSCQLALSTNKSTD